MIPTTDSGSPDSRKVPSALCEQRMLPLSLGNHRSDGSTGTAVVGPSSERLAPWANETETHPLWL
jgi:hypothetical protein